MFDLSFWQHGLLYGWLSLPWWQTVAVTLGLTHITIVSVTIFLHRSQCHRALDLHPIASHFFRFWLWMTTGMVTKEWVAVHRKHHATDEGPEDPHSPIQKGVNRVLWGGVFLYSEATRDREMVEKYGEGTPNDWLEHHVYTPHALLGIILTLLIDLGLFGLCGVMVWAVQMLWIPFWAAGVINGLGHYWGYRNYEPEDASRNLIPWGILIGGEELHNNHHAYSTSAKFSVKPWEFDIGWMYIRLLSVCGLATVKRTIPSLSQLDAIKVREAEVYQEGRDVEAVKVLLRNRMQVIEAYCCNVIGPIFREEKRRMRLLSFPHEMKVLRRAKKLLFRNRIHIGARNQVRLDQVLNYRERLKVVYQFRNQLHQICHQTQKLSRQEIMVALKSWCRQADETGIWALQRFSSWLAEYLPEAMVAVAPGPNHTD